MEISRYGTEHRGRVGDQPLVSIVIPTTDKEVGQAQHNKRLIGICSYNNTEVIIVNEGKERSVQRNIGIKAAKGKYIMYLDSDQYVTYGLIEECVFLMQNGYEGVYIPETIITEGWFAKLRNFERQFYNGTPVDCVRFFKREGCPMFDETITGPEDALHDRQIKGKKVVSFWNLRHDEKVGFIDYFKKKAYYSKSMKRYAELVGEDKCLDWKWRCFGVFFEKGKWRMALTNPVGMIGVYIIILIRGIIYMRYK